MASTERPEDPAHEDLTARARIRDAALLQFAEHGIKGATIRGIAEAAGVSPGLVQHHFGSKDELRRACDAYAMEVSRQATEIPAGRMADAGFMSAVMRTAMPVRRYVARAMVEGSPAAAEMFDQAIDLTKDFLEHPALGFGKPHTTDPHAYAVVLVAIGLGPLVLHEHLSRALGVDTLTIEGYPRLGLAMTEILADDTISPELVEKARAVFTQMMAGSSTPPTPVPDGDDDD